MSPVATRMEDKGEGGRERKEAGGREREKRWWLEGGWGMQERDECVRGRMKSDAVNKLIIGQSRWPSR